MKTKITFFLPSLVGGGVEKVFVTLANGLSKNNYSVDFVLSNAMGVHLSALDKEINVINLGKTHVATSFWGLTRYLRANQPPVIITGLSNANAAALLASRFFSRSTKTIITQHINWSQVLINNPSSKEVLVYYLSKYLYPLATRIVGISAGITNEIHNMRNIDPRKIVCIYNPVVTTQMLEFAKQQPHHKWFAKKNEPILIGAGRLEQQKDFETLIRAFHKVQSQIACKLIILGEGSERKKLERLIHDLNLTHRVELPGFFSNPYSFIAHADLFVLSSRYEGLPTVLIEAIGCKTPVVSTNCLSGPAEILDEGKYGKLVDVGNVDALAEAIIETIQKPLDKDFLMERAQLFSAENAINAYSDLIEQVLASGT
jgi:glycosyltransferase involved in cell wall biosynthesis